MRRLGDWLESFITFTASLPSPQIMRRWAGLTTISGALQRNVHTRIRSLTAYPNLYVMLIAPPGTGKTVALAHAARPFLENVPGVNLAPQAVTEQAFYGLMQAAGVAAQKRNPVEQLLEPECTMTAIIEEFGTFIRGEADGFMTYLTALYDCPDFYQYITKNQGENTIERAALTMAGGCTPRWVREVFTTSAMEKGFASRVIMVWSEEKVNVPLFAEVGFEVDEKLKAALQEDLISISKLRHKYVFDRDAAKFFTEWVEDGMHPVPSDPKLETYCTRRVIHATKLAMICRASRGNQNIINLEDIERAKNLLLTVEAKMHKVTANLGDNQLYGEMTMIERLVREFVSIHKRGMPEQVLRSNVASNIPVNMIEYVITGIISTGMVRVMGERGTRFFFPGDGLHARGALGSEHAQSVRAHEG